MLDKASVMRAFQVDKWGLDQLKMVEVPRPEPGPTEVLVRVKAVGLNPVDVITLEGRGHGSLTVPFIPAWDVAGVIEDLGYGVTRFKVGEEVYGVSRFPAAANACAEYYNFSRTASCLEVHEFHLLRSCSDANRWFNGVADARRCSSGQER